MNGDQIAGKWLQIKGEIRQRWGKLTGDDLEVIAGGKDKFVGLIQELYGIAKETAQPQIDHGLMATVPAESRSCGKSAYFVEEQAKPG